jgi:hypothetical protein
MKPHKVLLIVLPVLLMAVLFVVVRRQRSSAAYLLNQYITQQPGSAFLLLIKRWHIEDSTELTGKKPLLRISTFSKLQQRVAVGGTSLCVAPDSLPYSKSQKLRAYFSRFSESVQPLPPLEELMVVSFRQGGKWHTRLYNRKSPPPVMEEIDYLMYPNSPKSKARRKREQQAPKVLPMG